MHRFRIGNDIGLRWAVFYGGVPYDLTGKAISIKASTIYGEEPIEGYTVEGNIIRWVFKGSDQKRLGVYTLTLTAEGVGSRVVIDECKAFELVARGCPWGCEGGDVELASNLGFDAYDPHAVHYDGPQALTTADKVQVGANIGTRPLYILDLTDAVTDNYGVDSTEFDLAISDEQMKHYYGITVEEFAEIIKTHDVRFKLGGIILDEDGEVDMDRSWNDEVMTDTAIPSTIFWLIPVLSASYLSQMLEAYKAGISMMVLTKELAEGMGMGEEAMVMVSGADYYYTLGLNVNGVEHTYDPVYSTFDLSFYAPTSRGEKGQLLAGGDNSAPQWLPTGDAGAVLVSGGNNATPQWVMPEKSEAWELTNEWQTPEEDVLTCTAYDSTTGYFEVAAVPDWVTTDGEWACIGYTEEVLRGEIEISKAPLGSTKCNLVLIKKIDDTHIELVSSLSSTERARLTAIGATENLTIPSTIDVAAFTLTRAKSATFLNQKRFCTSVQFNTDTANDPKSGISRYKIVIEGTPLRTLPTRYGSGNTIQGVNHEVVVWPTKVPNNSQATYKQGYLKMLYTPDMNLRPFSVKMELIITVDFDTEDYNKAFVIEEIHCEGFQRGDNNTITPFIDPVITGCLGRGVGNSTYPFLLNMLAVTADTKVKIYKERSK